MNYRFSFFLIVTLFFATSSLSGQQKKLPRDLSLNEARQIAIKNNPDLQIKTIQVAIAHKQTEQAEWQKIPEVYANFDVRRNLIIPTTPVPAIAFDPNAKPDDIKPLKFQTNWTSNAGINAKMDIFNPDIHGKVKESQQKAIIKNTEKKISAKNLRFDISKDYAAVIIAQKQWQLAISDTLSKSKILSMAKAKYKSGRLKTVDLNQIISTKRQAISTYLKAEKILSSAKARLFTDMGFNPSKNYSVTFSDSLFSLLKQLQNLSLTNNNSSLSLKKQEQQTKLTALQLHNIRQGFLPTLSLNGFYGKNYFDNDFQFFKGENWYGNSYISLSINIPITRGIDRVKKIEALQLQQKADQMNYKSQQNQQQLAIIQAEQEIEYRKKDLLNKKKAWQLSRQNFKNAKEKFLNGRLLTGDFSKSNFQNKQAKTNYLQAAYDYIIAKMKLEKVSQ